MADQADETIIVRYVIDSGEAIKEAKRFRTEVDATKQQLKELANQSKMSMQDVAQGMMKAYEASQTSVDLSTGKIEKNTEAIRRNAQVVRTALGEATRESKENVGGFTGALQKLGSVGSFVFGSILGVTAVGILQKIIGLFINATETGLDFAQSVFKLGASVRALQRVGLDVTIEGTIEKVERMREEFGIFSRTELVQGISQIQLLTRNLGLSEQQIDDMTEAVATLSIIMGKDFGETARSVALFLSSGYGEALQRAGIAEANKAAVAQEALRLGFSKNYQELTAQQKAYAGLNVLLRGTLGLEEEIDGYLASRPGKIAKETAEIETQRDEIGQRLLPAKLAWYKSIGVLITAYDFLTTKLAQFSSSILTYLVTPLQFVSTLFRNVREEGKLTADVLANSWKEAFETVRGFFGQFIDTEVFEEIGTDLQEGFAGTADVIDEEAQEIERILKDLYEEIEKEQTRFQQRMEALERDLQNDLEKIDRDGARRREDLFRNLTEKIADINADVSRKIADAQRRYALDLAQLNRQFAIRRQEANRKYRENELKAEKDFQEKMRRLREEFLFDLGDALRERDARQVLRLIRRYNLDREQLERERGQGEGERKRAYRQELKDIEEQRKERIRLLKEELDYRIQQIRINAAREIAEAQLKYDREMEDLKRNLDAQREERRIRHEQQMEELGEQIKDRLEAFVNELEGMESLTGQAADAIVDELRKRFGPNSPMEGVINYVIGLIHNLIQAMQQVRNAQSNLYLPNVTPTTGGGGYAEGGTVIADKPTRVTFGEAGLEAATFTPLTRMGRDEGKIFGDGVGSSRITSTQSEGRATVLVRLSSGLVGEIVEDTMDGIADIMMEVQRRQP